MHRVRHPRIASLAFVAGLLMVLPSSHSSAQPRPICFTDRLAYARVPEASTIQAAALHGSATLVVWGAVRERTAGATIGQLYYQLMLDGNVGAPRLLVDSTFGPSRFVAVIPIDGGFLVWWNDRRGNRPGLYMRRVGLDGVLAGEPELFHASSIEDTAAVRILTTPSGFTLVWSGADRRLYVHRIDRSGAVLIDRASVGSGSGGGARRIPGLDDLIAVPTDAGLRLVDGTHRIRPAAVTLAELDGIHRILPDSSVALMRDSVVRVVRSLFDRTLVDTFVVPVPRAVLAFCALSVSSDGSLQVSYPSVHDTSGMPQALVVYAIQMDLRSGRPIEPRIAGTWIEMMDITTPATNSVAFQNFTRTYRCDNSTVINYTFVRTYYPRGGGPPYFRTELRGHIVSAEGTIQYDGPLVPAYGLCDDIDSASRTLAVQRVEGAIGSSAVRCSGVTLAAPSMVVRRLSKESESNVFVEDAMVRVAYRSSWEYGRYGYLDWSAAGADSASEIPAMHDVPDQYLREEYVRVPGAALVARTSHKTMRTPGGVSYPVDVRSEAIFVGRKWTPLYAEGHLGDPVKGFGVSLGGTDIASFSMYQASLRVNFCGLDSAARWRVSYADTTRWQRIVAIDSSRALLLYPRGPWNMLARVVGPGISTKAFTIVEPDTVRAALPAGAGLFLLVGSSRIDGTLHVRRVRTDGTVVATDTVAALTGARDLYCFVDRADTTVVLLAATDAGIHLARVTAGHPSSPWVSIVADNDARHPSAIYHGDSLYVTWTSWRPDDSDVFGIALARAELPSPTPDPPFVRDAPPGTEIAITAVSPTPSTKSARLHLVVSQSCAIGLSIYDSRGELVDTREYEAHSAGAHDITIDVSAYIDGVYHVRAASGAQQAFARIGVVHDWR